MLVLLQGTFTPLVHAHAGRTQTVGADRQKVNCESQRISAAAQLNRWEGLRCNVMVSCIHPCGLKTPDHAQFEVQKLTESKKKNRHEFPCLISGRDEWQNIDQLLHAPTA